MRSIHLQRIIMEAYDSWRKALKKKNSDHM